MSETLQSGAAARRPPFVLWPLTLGALGFIAGFIGPVVLSPDANQGPLLGIFITGPGGALLGLILGLAVRLLHCPPTLEWQILFGAAILLVFATLYLSFPEPRVRGYVIEAEIRHCAPPPEAMSRAVRRWERILAGNLVSPGWQEAARRSVEADTGVVLQLWVERRINVYEHRKPWNRGRITVAEWRPMRSTRRYYARYAGPGCEHYPTGARFLRYAALRPPVSTYDPRGWPPTTKVPDFLNLQTIEPVPEAITRLIEARSGR